MAATIDPSASRRELLVQLLLTVDANHATILERLQTMDQRIQTVIDGEAAERAQIELLIAAFQAQAPLLASLQQQIADLRANGFLTDEQAGALAATAANMAAEASKVSTVLTPPPAP
jgi:hypothetical protein